MAGYIGSKASVVSSGAERKKVFSITTTTSSLTGLSYTPNQVHVFHNGVRLVDGTDYTATNGTSITLTTAAENGDQVVVISYATFQTSDTVSASAGGTFSNDVAINGNLTVDTNTLFVDAASNNVGIGTSSPGAKLQVNGNTAQYSASIAVRVSGNQYEFGHSNTAGYGSVIGAEVGSGAPFIALQAGAGTNNNTYRTFGIAGSVISTNNAGALTFSSVTNSNADNQTAVERMRIDAAGRVTQPFQPAFRAVKNDSHVTSTGVIVFDTKSFDVGNNYNNSTGVFTAPVAGRYFFSFSTLLWSMGGNSYAQLNVNGSFYSHFGTYGAFTGSYAGQGASTIADLSANDTVTIYYNHSTTNLHLSYTWWSGYLLG